ncbi:MAG: hypothetical protein ABMB14_28840 [Myxococcota bacterium]
MARLLAAPVDRAAVEAVIARPMEAAGTQGPYALFTGRGGGFERVRLQVPGDGATAGPGLELVVGADTCKTVDDAFGLFGHLFRIANPHAPPDSDPVWRVAAYDDRGELYLTFAAGSGCLRAVNLHVR